MRRVVGLVVVVLVGWTGTATAAERPIEELPGDVGRVIFAWTEPIKQVAKRSRELDPVSGLWIGLIDGSVKSVERTAQFLLEDRSSATQEPGKIFRYSF